MSIPAERLRPIVERYIEENGANNRTHGSLPRRVYRILNEVETLSMATVDRLLVDMDAVEEWHVELADLYEATIDAPKGFGGPAPKLPRSKVRHVHTLYRGGMSLPQLAELLYDSYGYATRHSCENALKRAFRRAGYRRRTKGEAARLHYRDEPCAGCGCAMQERSANCAACTRRHFRYRQQGRPNVLAKCVGCGISHPERTRGCGDCTSRHHRRRLRGISWVDIRRTTCVRCDVDYDERTPGCIACRKRADRRRLKSGPGSSSPALRTADTPGGGTATRKVAA